MKKKTFLWISFLLLTYSMAIAQDISRVTGVVTSSEDGLPIIGASVRVKGTDWIAVTDIDGKFEISGITGTHKTLVVSYVGMQTKEVALRAVVDVVLDP
ncbi:carboxypeptidase-like regulatory domain-containing protein [Prevotella sp. Rep29]|uniref:carboxypeptidase-like regulatory domain-containing protein n=1 Tax=Prevotella sp. Rep29 TaxID=2691580 RepID=UPI001C6DD991|nr:carboxypeptidase-like regulatory domain-containing protein [Prevotella sp. Rep29]QYR10008.1 hypothetical protein GRF55_02255 [Prevotella sp. Rep29]